ncbi:MFS transporter [Streptomyces sp. NPDC087437]|uniref:MFS transporter n=1 Tax=Streptomyces sp. NPDC087437 TaxID=3365789 RepID=UPI0038244892
MSAIPRRAPLRLIVAPAAVLMAMTACSQDAANPLPPAEASSTGWQETPAPRTPSSPGRKSSMDIVQVSVRSEIKALRQGRLWLALAAAVLIVGGVLATYTFVTPLLTDRAGIPAGAVPLVLIVFGAGALGGTVIGGRFGDRRPMTTTIPAAAATALVLLALTPLATTPAVAVALIFLMALAGFTINPVITALAVRFAGDAPTLTSALTTSAYDTGIAAGSALAGQALASSLGVTGPALVGAVFAGLTLLPLIALAFSARRGTTHIVAQGTAAEARALAAPRETADAMSTRS